MFHLNTRSHHLLVCGDQFFELHQKYKELYEFLGDLTDEIQELTFERTYLQYESERVFDLLAAMESSVIPKRVGICEPEEINPNIYYSLLTVNALLEDFKTQCQDDYVCYRINHMLKEIKGLIWQYSRLCVEGDEENLESRQEESEASE